jgi:hypothetical protein
MSDDLVKSLHDINKNYELARGVHVNIRKAADRIEELEAENEKLRKGLDIYERERNRFRHAKPEITGAYFLSGGHGEKDDNLLPQFVRIVPAYGCAWEQVYEKTDKTISYEGS